MDFISIVNKCVEKEYEKTGKLPKFIIFPFGEEGRMLNSFLKEAYDIEPAYIIDSFYSKYNPKIKPLSFLGDINCDEYIVIVACTSPHKALKMENLVLQYVSKANILDLSEAGKIKRDNVGRYSYGALCGNPHIESIGNFCSISDDCGIRKNHSIKYISTHPIMYCNELDIFGFNYDEAKKTEYYMEGIQPKGKSHNNKKHKIGHDVWIGSRALLLNSCNIGNGAIVAAGAVVTKDVPDYAVVAGVPAKVIRYRYTPEQIEALNRIEWWNWTDDEIRERYDDFFIDIEEFIAKYDVK